MTELDRSQILGPDGEPIPRRVTARDRVRGVSLRTRTIALAVLAMTGTLALSLTNISTIAEWFETEAPLPQVPAVQMRLHNSGEAQRTVISRGDFMLFFAGPGARHTFGKYELAVDGQSDDLIVLLPGETVSATATIPTAFADALDRRDRDIAFHVRTREGSLRITGNLPFTREAIRKYVVEIDVARKVGGFKIEAPEPLWSEWAVAHVNGPTQKVRGEEPHEDGFVSATIPESATMLPNTLERAGGSEWGKWYEEDPSISNAGRTITCRYKNWKREGTEIRIRVQYLPDDN